jgi:hypothetical protein
MDFKMWIGPKIKTFMDCFRIFFLFAGGVITWASKKQTFVALSNIESEYMALSKATIEVI